MCFVLRQLYYLIVALVFLMMQTAFLMAVLMAWLQQKGFMILIVLLTLQQSKQQDAPFNITQTRRQYDVIKPASQATTDCELQIATTDDDPTSGSATFSAFSRVVAGDYSARGFKFRLKMTTSDIDDTPVVSALQVNLSLARRTESQGNISSGTASTGKVITFTNAFGLLMV